MLFYHNQYVSKDGSFKINQYPNNFIFMLEGCLHQKKNFTYMRPYPITPLSRLEYWEPIAHMFQKASQKKYQMVPLYPFLATKEEQDANKHLRQVIVYNPQKKKEIITFFQIQNKMSENVFFLLCYGFLEYICQGYTKQEAYGEILRKIIVSKSKISFYDVGINIDKFILFQKAETYFEKKPTLHDGPYVSKMHILKEEYPVQWKQLLEVVNQIEKRAFQMKKELEENNEERKGVEQKLKQFSQKFYIDPAVLFLNPYMTWDQIATLRKMNPIFLKGMPFFDKTFS